jgi:hypothetical protein
VPVLPLTLGLAVDELVVEVEDTVVGEGIVLPDVGVEPTRLAFWAYEA